MKTLHILRHADALPPNTAINDFNRSVSPLGQTQIRSLKGEFFKKNYEIDYIISSSSIRTRMTVEILIHGNQELEKLTHFYKELYNSDLNIIIKFIKNTPNHVKSLLLVGHNPGITNLVCNLNSNQEKHTSTCELNTFELHINSWEEFTFHESKYLWNFTPKLI